MYGMPGLGFGAEIKRVTAADDVQELIKEANLEGMPSRTFFGTSGKLLLSFDGMFVIDNLSGEIVPDDELQHTVDQGLFTRLN